jgi:hypothetical protein
MVLIRFLFLLFLSVLTAAFVSFGTRDALAQSAACDTDFETVLEARATLEAMREVEIAQTLILKPDSVLEMSCFDDRLNELAAHADAMFSDNTFSADLFNIPAATYTPSGTYASYLPTIDTTAVTTPHWGPASGYVVQTGPNPPWFPPGMLFNSGLNTALGNLVYATMYQYLLSSFSHVYAGGTFGSVPTTPGVCNPMDLVWHFVKCTDFNAGLFRTHAELAAFDPRLFPFPCNDPNRSTQWTNALAAAYPAPSATGASGGVVSVVTHINQFDGSACSAVTPIPTGVQVYAGSPPGFTGPDHVCPAAGCYYDGSGCVP